MAHLFFVGAGGFGIALGVMAQREGHSVTLWAHSEDEADMLRSDRENKKLLPGVVLPPDINITTNFAAVPQADVIIIVTPSHAVREVSRQLAGCVAEHAVVVCASKGLEAGSNKRMSEVMAEELPHCRCVILSGPSHAEEVTRDVPTAVVAAGRDRAATERAQELLCGKNFRIYCNDDVAGVELGGALKNVIALAAGIVDGLGLGDNAKAALMTRGLTEIARLGIACGARSETFAGLSGMGDLIVTCTSRHSRNRSAGLLIGGGKSAQEAMDEVGKTVEGYICTRAAYELSQKLGVEMPITAAVYNVLYEGGCPTGAAAALMGRPKRHESESIWPV